MPEFYDRPVQIEPSVYVAACDVCDWKGTKTSVYAFSIDEARDHRRLIHPDLVSPSESHWG